MDSDERADEAWLLGFQRKIYQWSRNNPDELLSRIVELGNRPAQLACAWRKIASNKAVAPLGSTG